MTVTFSNVEVREYKREVSYNPSVTSGIPIGLSWNVIQTSLKGINQYESERSASRRDIREFSWSGRIDPETRLRICLDAGYTFAEIEHILADVNQIQQSRLDSLPSGFEFLVDYLVSTKALFFDIGRQSIKKLESATKIAKKLKDDTLKHMKDENSNDDNEMDKSTFQATESKNDSKVSLDGDKGSNSSVGDTNERIDDGVCSQIPSLSSSFSEQKSQSLPASPDIGKDRKKKISLTEISLLKSLSPQGLIKLSPQITKRKASPKPSPTLYSRKNIDHENQIHLSLEEVQSLGVPGLDK